MSEARLHRVRRGSGPTLLMIHGSAADLSTWTIQLASLRQRFDMLAYDRRGTGRSPLPAGRGWLTVEEHADDAAALIEDALGEPAVVVGSSFGGVIALELIRRRPDLVRGAVLCEPPLAPADTVAAVPVGFGCAFDRIARAEGGEAAGAFFLRTVLGDAAYERMPEAFAARARGMWQAIRGDCLALGRYSVRYDRLGAVRTPCLLVGGERSAPMYRPTLEALAAALPASQLCILAGAGHMLHAEAHRRFAAAVQDFETGLAAGTRT